MPVCHGLMGGGMRRGKVEHARSQSGYLRQRRARGHRETIPLQDLPGGALHGYGRAVRTRVHRQAKRFFLCQTRSFSEASVCDCLAARHLQPTRAWLPKTLGATTPSPARAGASWHDERSWLWRGGGSGGTRCPTFFLCFFSHTILRPVRARSQCSCKLRAYGALEAAALVPARIGEDLMQIRHGPLAQLGGRGQLEQRRRVGALSRDREHITGPSRDPG